MKYTDYRFRAVVAALLAAPSGIFVVVVYGFQGVNVFGFQFGGLTLAMLLVLNIYVWELSRRLERAEAELLAQEDPTWPSSYFHSA